MNTQKLKELARRATGGIWKAFINEKTNTFAIHTPDDARCGNIVDWMGFDGVNCSKKQKAHNARFIAASNPAVVIQLIEAFEAAERERDELRSEAEKYAQLAGKNAARAQKAEGELVRRDAAAGEAVSTQLVYSSVLPKFIGDTDEVESYSCFISGETPPRKTMTEAYADAKQVCGELYTAALPVALAELEQDVKNIIDLLSENEWAKHCTKSELGRKLEGEITRLHDLRAQQQKVVELPTSFNVIGENIRSQNNRCTADPIFCVFEKVPTPAAEGYNHTRIEWYDSDHDRDATPLQAARLEALFDGGRCDDNDYKCWRRLAMHDVDTFVTACFTAKGCEDYLAQNGHNLRQPFVYVTSAYRNDEYKAVREWLMQLAAAPAPGGDGVKQG